MIKMQEGQQIVDKRIKIQKEQERLEQWGKSSKQNLE